MNNIAHLFTLYEQVRLNLHMSPGSIFKYNTEHNGLKIIAEIIARFRQRGFASLFIPSNSVANVFILPTVKFRNTFQTGNKLDSLYKDGYYILAIQYEHMLDTGNFIVLQIDDAGSKVSIFNVYKCKEEPIFVTDVDMSYEDELHENLVRLFRLIISELDLMNDKETSSSICPYNHF